VYSTEKRKGKTNISVTASTAVGTATKFVDLMNTQQYLSMRKQAFINDGIPISDTDYDVNGAWDQTRYTNWQKELLGGSATINDFRTSISGGSETTQFLISGNYRTEEQSFQEISGTLKEGILSINHTSLDKKLKSLSGNYTAQILQAATDLTLTARYLAPNAPALYDSNVKSELGK
jgi:hypothetical protein